MDVNNVKKVTINAKIKNAENLQSLKRDDIKDISVVVSLANTTTEADSCVSLFLAKNISFFIEGNILTISFDAIIKASKYTYYHYLDESYAFAAIEIESDQDIELCESAVITYMCDGEREDEDLTILSTYEAVEVENDEDYDDDDSDDDEE